MNEKEIKLFMQKSSDEGFKTFFDEYWSYAYTIINNVLRGLQAETISRPTLLMFSAM